MTTLLPLILGWLLAPFCYGVSPELDELVQSYFRSRNSDQRAELADSIEELTDGDLALVADALQEVQLWDLPPGNTGHFMTPSDTEPTVIGSYQLPPGYDPRRRYPVIICMPEDQYSCLLVLGQAMEMLHQTARESVLLCPQWPEAASMHQPGLVSGYINRLLRHTRKYIHTDTDRVYVFGVGKGGDAAWLVALTHSNWLAGAIILSGFPQLPYPESTIPLLLENLRGLEILTAWDAPSAVASDPRVALVSAHNRAIAAWAKKLSVPIHGIELDADHALDSPDGIPETLEVEFAKILKKRRKPVDGQVSHWFRYGRHGRAGWLTQTRFKGAVWEAQQMAILPPSSDDRNAYITEVIKDKLAYLGGRIEDQQITIETQHCAKIELLLPDGLLDWDRPVIVRCNGSQRYNRIIRPSIHTMLETAYQDWDFQRLSVARLSIAIRSDMAER